MSGQTTPPVAPPVTIPLVLSHEESVELENFQLKLKVIQIDISDKYKDLQGEVNKYQEDVLKNHPGVKYQLNMGNLTWQPIPPPPAPPKPTETPKPEAKAKK